MTTSTVPNSTTIEATSLTALIIPFPARSKPAAPPPEERLARALVSLNAALAEQRVVVAAWRKALEELKVSTARLSDSVKAYQANLKTLGNSVSSLNAKSRSLEAWATGVTTTTD